MWRTAGTRRTRRRRQFLAEYKKCRRDLEDDVKYREEKIVYWRKSSEQDIRKQLEKQNGKTENNPPGCMRLEMLMSAVNGSAKLTHNSAPSANCKADVTWRKELTEVSEFYTFHSVHYDSFVTVWPTNAHTSLELQYVLKRKPLHVLGLTGPLSGGTAVENNRSISVCRNVATILHTGNDRKVER